jgi:hypothetical protein
MLVFKENVKGFIYNSIFGICFDLNKSDELDEDDIDIFIIDNEDDLNDLFNVKNEDDLNNDDEGLKNYVEFKNN